MFTQLFAITYSAGETRAWESGHFAQDKRLTPNHFRDLLRKKINNLDVGAAIIDIKRFVVNQEELKIWSRQYFLDLVERIQIIT